MVFQVRVDEATSYRFTSRPGAFSMGRFDDGARAWSSNGGDDGDRVLDIGCGSAPTGFLAARLAGPDGFVPSPTSNLRAGRAPPT